MIEYAYAYNIFFVFKTNSNAFLKLNINFHYQLINSLHAKSNLFYLYCIFSLNKERLCKVKKSWQLCVLLYNINDDTLTVGVCVLFETDKEVLGCGII